jgi:hypothetical protein
MKWQDEISPGSWALIRQFDRELKAKDRADNKWARDNREAHWNEWFKAQKITRTPAMAKYVKTRICSAGSQKVVLRMEGK